MAATLYEENFPHMTPAWSRIFNFVAERAEGSYIYTEDGRKLLDFTSGIGTANADCNHSQSACIRSMRVSSYHHTSGERIIFKNNLMNYACSGFPEPNAIFITC